MGPPLVDTEWKCFSGSKAVKDDAAKCVAKKLIRLKTMECAAQGTPEVLSQIHVCQKVLYTLQAQIGSAHCYYFYLRADIELRKLDLLIF
ncbi:hypothetical protein ONV78_04985 [Hahella sp. CR1]|uniref:hypothetical protein n=1 Tax=Hahella sp. CR1 TaxID=2992807 RepID=UPI002441C71C|nr:hypothetical protein [Hahella sp. CR1]MDG9667083.1 hypothetical protein [Hahella sp. CR1]